MTDQSTKVAAWLATLAPNADIASMRSEIIVLFPRITRSEWMRGFQIADECTLLDALDTSVTPFDLNKRMLELGWPEAAAA